MGAFEVFADSSGKITDVRPFPPLTETEARSLISIVKQLAFHAVRYQGAPVPFVSVLALCTDTDRITLPCAPKLNANGGVDGAIPQRLRSLMCEDPKSWSKCNLHREPAKTKRISGMNPRYPDDAKHARVTGTVMVRVVVSTGGDVMSVQVLGGPPMLYRSATDAIRTWKYKPLLWKGVPVEVEGKVVTHYELSG
jgi:TonB family protein